MDFHPSQIPVSQTFQVDDEYQAIDIVSNMIHLGFTVQKGAFRILMTNDKKIAKKIGYVVMNELSVGLRKAKQERDVRYWIYNYDSAHYAMILISSKVLESLGF